MLSLTTRSNDGKAEMLFDADDNGMYFTVLVGNSQYEFEVSPEEWRRLKEFVEGVKSGK